MRHNIFTISLCIHCTYNVNLYYRPKKLANFVHIYQICTIFTIFCANVYNINHFLYLQCKLALQVQSKHIKILKKQNKNKAQTNWHT